LKVQHVQIQKAQKSSAFIDAQFSAEYNTPQISSALVER
jgi:hypothetical protein